MAHVESNIYITLAITLLLNYLLSKLVFKHLAKYITLAFWFSYRIYTKMNFTQMLILKQSIFNVYFLQQGYNSGETNAASKDITTATSTAITTTDRGRVYSGLPTLCTTAIRYYRGKPLTTTLPLPVNTNSSTITAEGIPANDQCIN